MMGEFYERSLRKMEFEVGNFWKYFASCRCTWTTVADFRTFRQNDSISEWPWLQTSVVNQFCSEFEGWFERRTKRPTLLGGFHNIISTLIGAWFWTIWEIIRVFACGFGEDFVSFHLIISKYLALSEIMIFFAVTFSNRILWLWRFQTLFDFEKKMVGFYLELQENWNTFDEFWEIIKHRYENLVGHKREKRVFPKQKVSAITCFCDFY